MKRILKYERCNICSNYNGFEKYLRITGEDKVGLISNEKQTTTFNNKKEAKKAINLLFKNSKYTWNDKSDMIWNYFYSKSCVGSGCIKGNHGYEYPLNMCNWGCQNKKHILGKLVRNVKVEQQNY